MAKKKKKLIDDSKDKQLQIIANQYFPSALSQKFLDAIASTGTIPQELFTQGNFSPSDQASVLDMVHQITGGNPTERELSRDELKDELLDPKGKQVDEAKLTDEELLSRKGIYEDLGTSKQSLGRGELEEAFRSKLKAYGVDPDINGLYRRLTDIVIEKGRYPGADEFRQAFGETEQEVPVYEEDADGNRIQVGTKKEKVDAGIPPALNNFFNDQDARNDLSGLVDRLTKAPEGTDEDVKRIDDLISTRKTEADRNTQIDKFITDIPGELSGPTNSRIKMLREIGGRQFEQDAPALVARENALGRFSSGAVGDVVGSRYSDINASIESEAANLLAGDEQFYFNAAYQNQVRKLLEGKSDLTSSIGVERQNVRNQQESRFQQGQFDLNANLENDLLMQKYEAQLKSAQAARQRQQDLAAKQSRFGTAAGIGGLAGLAGGLIGTALMPGAGTAAGYGLGASLGGAGGTAIGGLFGSQ